LNVSSAILKWILALTSTVEEVGVTLNNASDYRTNGLYWTPSPNPHPILNPSSLLR